MRKIFEAIQQYHMIEPGMRVVAGISGGADSVCLLYVLTEYRKTVPFELMAVHVEHGIRGEESLGDAEFTGNLCEELGVLCRVCPAQVKELAERTGQSLEEAGREERYRIFEEIRREWKADRIAVAHNENDQAETLLWNLVRGSGVKGLGGIRPVRDCVIRPLLFTPRWRIEELLREAGLGWRTDRTNLETEYTRNRIRHRVLPLLSQELNEKAAAHLAQTALHMQEIYAFLEGKVQTAARQCIRKEGTAVRILLEDYQQQERLIRRELLRYAVSQCESGLKDVGAVHIGMLEELAKMDCGKECCLPGKIRAVREDGALCLRPGSRAGKDMEKNELPGEVTLVVPGRMQAGTYRIQTELLDNDPELEMQIQEEKKYTKWLSCDTITGNVCLRTRRSGDYLVINGQGGRKKLKDYFIDLKIPREERDRICLVADGSHILWVVGYRISEDAKVKKETKQILKIQMKEEEK